MSVLTKIETWNDFCVLSRERSNHLPDVYKKRLEFELFEVNKQGLNTIWIDYYNNQSKFDSNPNNLVLPWVLGLLINPLDPISSRQTEMLCTTRYQDVSNYINKYGNHPVDFIKDSDVPDIDIDCLPEARDSIKEYAIRKYGKDSSLANLQVASVGTWQTYKLKAAIQDAAAATGTVYRTETKRLTSELPEDLDLMKPGGYGKCKGKDSNNGEIKECGFKHKELVCPKCGSDVTESPTIAKLIHDFPELAKFATEYPKVLDYATRMVGRIRNMGMHAGALIIANQPLLGKIPLAKNGKDGQFVTMWSEGSNQQLSKCGYIKWDILGLKTLAYIYDAIKLIVDNRQIKFGIPQEIEGYGGCYELSGLDEINPEENCCGKFYTSDGEEHIIKYDDAATFSLFNNQMTDTIFQFDTPLAKRILSDASVGTGVNNHEILTLLNAMGHPGPMQSIPDALKNRDDVTQSWRERLRKIHPIMEEVLSTTLGVCVYQEQLTALWQRLAGFSATEAQLARKDIAKKRVDKLKKIKEKWIAGASKTLGEKFATEYWDVLETFGRYAFNRSHAIAYCAVIAYRCAWFKAHFFPEWIAAVLSRCDVKKIPRYIAMAKTEGWRPTPITKLGKNPDEKYNDFSVIAFDINKLTPNFSVIGNILTVGILSVKGIGESDKSICDVKGPFVDIDDFIERTKAGKTVIERLVRLKAFAVLKNHDNSFALLQYYYYKYKKMDTKSRNAITEALKEQQGWNRASIAAEISRQKEEYFNMYPKRKKVPPKFDKWEPDVEITIDEFNKLYPNDYKTTEILAFEKEYLGYNLSNPLSVYKTNSRRTILAAIEAYDQKIESAIEVIIIEKHIGVTAQKETPYCRLEVTDGVSTSTVFIWKNSLDIIRPDLLNKGQAVMIPVKYQPVRKSFSMINGKVMIPLIKKDE